MTTPPATSPGHSPARSTDALRVSDAERERAVSLLQDAYAEGRLDNAELDLRIEKAFAARTRADLGSVLQGLPLGQRQPVGSPAGSAVQPITPLDRSWAMVAHWLGLVSLFVGPAIVAATKGRSSRYIREQAWEATNFQLTFLGACIALGMVTAVTFGVAGVFFPILGMAWFVLGGIAGLAAAAGNRFRYPFVLRLFR